MTSMENSTGKTNLKKPILRGYLHQEAFFVSLGAVALLIAKSSRQETMIASVIYSSGLLFLFACSAIYHRFTWKPKIREVIQRFDHSAIFIFIACTVTPIGLLATPQETGSNLLTIIWLAAIAGTLLSILWINTPKWLMAALCILMGWLSFAYLEAFKENMSKNQLIFLIIGGVVYSIGAIFYATKAPKLWPSYFGYHELFHFCTIVAAAFHFASIYPMIN